jgi:hypothetical protein
MTPDFRSASGVAVAAVEQHEFGSAILRASIDVTGGNLSTLPEHIMYRLACMLYVCLTPQTGLAEAYESLADIYNWHARPISPPLQPDRQSLFVATKITEVKAPPMVFDED